MKILLRYLLFTVTTLAIVVPLSYLMEHVLGIEGIIWYVLLGAAVGGGGMHYAFDYIVWGWKGKP